MNEDARFWLNMLECALGFTFIIYASGTELTNILVRVVGGIGCVIGGYNMKEFIEDKKEKAK